MEQLLAMINDSLQEQSNMIKNDLKTLETALIELNRATDGQSRYVVLHSGPPTAEALRQSTRDFAANMLGTGAVFIDSSGMVSRNGEIAAWDNLALLAAATAAAVREGA